MPEVKKEFRQAVAAELDGMAKEDRFAPAEIGEDRQVAKTVVEGMAGGLHPRLLGVVQRRDCLSIELRNVFRCGSAGAQVNRAVDYVMDKLFMPPDDDDGLGRDQVEMCGGMVDLFRSERRTIEDLLGLCVAASNAYTVHTHAQIDFSDGEVVVDVAVPCDFEEVPPKFKDFVSAVLSHSALLIRLEKIIRNEFCPDNAPSPRVMSALLDKADKARGRQESGAKEKEEALAI